MSARILTREQLAELAVLETTPGPWTTEPVPDRQWRAPQWALIGGRRTEALLSHTDGDTKREIVVWVEGSQTHPPHEPDLALIAAAPDLLATARDRELRIIDLERRLNMRESVLCDASADLHALTEEARELGTDAHLDDLRAFVSRLVDVYAGAAGRAVVEERDALRLERDRLQRELAVECFDAAAAPAGWRPDGTTWIGSGVYLVNLHGSGWTAYADTDGLRIPLRSTRLSGSWATALRAMEDPELPDVIARVSGG